MKKSIKLIFLVFTVFLLSCQESAIKSAVVSGNKGVVYDSKNDLVLEEVNIVSTGKFTLQGKNISLKPLETTSWTEAKEKKRGFAGKIGGGGISVSYGTDKFSSGTKNQEQHSSEITSAQNIEIKASDKVSAKAVNIYAAKDINISGDKGVDFSSATNSQETEVKQSSTRFTAGIYVNSAIVNTVDNIKNMDKLIDKSGDAYGVINTASNLVGAIRTGANAVNTVFTDKSKDNGDSSSVGLQGISMNPKDYIRISAGISKSKSNSKTYKESAVKSSIEGKNIAINSKEGSVSLEGTDITAKNLDIKAKEHIEIKAATEEQKSSNHSSDRGISASLSFDSVTPVMVTASASGAKGRGNGTTYVNSILHVEETLKTESENLKVSGANIEADKVAMKAKDIVIESKQDVSKRKDSSYGASVSVGLTPTGAIIPKDISVNGSKGKGEGEWVEKQTSLIARKGGTIEADNKLTNTGAVIGSLSEDEKLKVSANEIEVSDLEDKNKYENIGGGISVGFDNGKPKVPNVKVSHDKIDKEQINRATAINTEFTIAGEEKTSEELGFNTDLTKAQETTKDEEKHLNADLHTDLTNKEERDKLVLAGRKIETVIENIADNKGTTTANAYKAGLRGIHVDEVRKEKQKEFNFADDKNTEPLDMQRALIDLQAQIYEKEGYKGPLPKIYLTDEPNSFAVDGKNGEPRKIFISINDLKRGEASAILYAHENAHLVHYDKGEEMAKYAETKIGENNPNIKFTEREKEAYVQDLRKRIEVEPLEKQFEIARNIDKNDRENFSTEIFTAEAYSFGGRISRTQSVYTLMNEENKTSTNFNIGSTSVGFGGLDIGVSAGMGFYYDDTVEDLSQLTESLGISFSLLKGSLGADLLFKKNSYIPRGIRVYFEKSAVINPIPMFTIHLLK